THFRGVSTVVLKLLQILPADRAYFGEKDFQQLQVIRAMANDFHLPTEIIGCPIVRDVDGLALSSRNQYLSSDERKRALALSSCLQETRALFDAGERSVAALESRMKRILEPSVDRIDYAVVVDAVTLDPIREVHAPAVALIAAYVGSTRLIDNCQLP
ncbi:MAG: pantoate--beta-alanine ligase, partial [Planctomycetales bacterium]|nr:pantoate--beta-alanine ligase [Planctomycetales bacterium]